MVTKAKGKKSKKEKEESAEEHRKKHSPDVKRLLEEYEQKESDIGEEAEYSEQHFSGKTVEDEEEF